MAKKRAKVGTLVRLTDGAVGPQGRGWTMDNDRLWIIIRREKRHGMWNAEARIAKSLVTGEEYPWWDSEFEVFEEKEDG